MHSRFHFKKIATSCLLLLAELCILIALYLLAMTITCSYSNEKLLQNMDASLQILSDEGNYPIYLYGDEGVRLDNFTDQIIVGNADITSDSPLISALYVKGYSRYWHGYLVFVKPLLTFIGLFQIRKLLLLILGGSFFVSLYLIYRRFGVGAAIAYLIMWFEYYSAVVAGSLQFFWCYAIMYLSVILLLLFYRPEGQAFAKLPAGGYCGFVLPLFLAVGSFTNFTDFLTFPLVTLTLPLIIFVLTELFYTSLDGRKILGCSVLLSFTWCLGYALTWIGKWLLSAILLPGDIFFDVRRQIAFRVNGNAEYPINRWNVLTLNLSHPYFLKHTLILLILLLCAIVWNLRRKETRRRLCRLLPLFPILLYPYLWYEFMCNHSMIHNFFTYRAQMGTSFGLYLILILLLLPRAFKRTRND